MSFIQEHPQGIAFRVYIQPRSSKNMIVGLHADALKIKLMAPPVDGAANKMCLQFLARTLGVSKSSLEILSGQSSRTKRLLVRYAGDKTTEMQKERLRDLVMSLCRPSSNSN